MQFTFIVTDVQQQFLVQYPYAALDGKLTIYLNGNVFFEEEGISLLAFAICITHWLASLTSNQLPDFDYSSDEYLENPVLRLVKLNDHYFSIHSAWVDDHTNNVLGLEEIILCFRNFLRELEAVIQQQYGLSFAQIPLLSR